MITKHGLRYLVCFFSGYFCASPAQSAEPYAEMYIWKAELTRASDEDTLQFWVNYAGLDRPVLDYINLQIYEPFPLADPKNWVTAISVSSPDTQTSNTLGTFPMTYSGDIQVQNNYFIRSDGRRDQPNEMNDVLMIRDAATVIAPTADSAFGLTEAKAFEHPRDHFETFVRAYGAVGEDSTNSYWLEWWQWNYASNSWVEQDESPYIDPGETLVYTFHKKLDRDYVDKSVTPPKMEAQIRFRYTILDAGATQQRVFNPELREKEKPVSSLSGQKNITNATIENQAAQTQTSFDYHFDWRERFEMKVAITVNAVEPPLGTYWLHGWWHFYGEALEELKVKDPTNVYYIVTKPILSYLPYGNGYSVTTQLEGYGGPKTDIDFIDANYDNSLPNHKVVAQDSDP